MLISSSKHKNQSYSFNSLELKNMTLLYEIPRASNEFYLPTFKERSPVAPTYQQLKRNLEHQSLEKDNRKVVYTLLPFNMTIFAFYLPDLTNKVGG